MLALFKGELSYTEILWGMPYKDLIGLRDARLEQYEEERKEAEAEAKQVSSENIRNTILAK